MVAFYKEVCIIYGAEHPLHILWLYNFISGLVAQLGERSVRIREVVGSNPIRSTKQVLDEHLFLQRRFRRKVFALIHNRKAPSWERSRDGAFSIFLKRSKTLHLYTLNAKEGCVVMTFLYMNCGIPSFSNSI